MCGTCGCENTEKLIPLERRVLGKNDELAAKNRAWLEERAILAVNVLSSPGSGKTTLLERTIRDLGATVPITVIEGDQATENDARRIRAAGARAVQINTGTGCHLDASMVARALEELRPESGSIVFIENVGNLVCPALFDLGERVRAVVSSVTEGEDKPVKYPHMFRAAGVLVLNKTDLTVATGFDESAFRESLRAVNPEAHVLPLSARTGEGLGAWYDWLRLASR
ncbi:MAG TPA: hydrogenase nickel incorporation protein HypB [Planctomycetota bacterium]|nr:hydrogenase nickel incorporation protein HypB [Planctomycetota bacterium]